MSVDLTSLGQLITELEANNDTVDSAMNKCNERLKLLRILRDMQGVESKPTPRKSRQKVEA